MHVEDHEAQSWFLLLNQETLIFDVNCNHSAFGYSWVIELHDHEVMKFEAEGLQLADSFSK